MDQTTKLASQVPSSGRTTGRVNAALKSSPTSKPFDHKPVARVIACGNHCRTRAGRVGWLMLIARPMQNVMANNIGTLGPRPRSAEETPIIESPKISARRGPTLAISSEPGTAPRPRSSTGKPDSAATPFSSNCRSAWMSGSTGGTASSVSRMSLPASHNNPSHHQARGIL